MSKECNECEKCGEHALECGCISTYRYWKDEELEIRTCNKCKLSHFKSQDDGTWILYFTKERIEHCIENMLNEPEEFDPPPCNWCGEILKLMREVGPNYICYDCEKKERAAGRPLIFTSPVRDAYFSMEETK